MRLLGCFFAGEIFVRNIVTELVGIAFVAAEQRADRIALEFVFVARGEQCLQLFAFGHLRFCVMLHRQGAGAGGERLGVSDAAKGQQAGADEKGERCLDHIRFLSKTVVSS